MPHGESRVSRLAQRSRQLSSIARPGCGLHLCVRGSESNILLAFAGACVAAAVVVVVVEEAVLIIAVVVVAVISVVFAGGVGARVAVVLSTNLVGGLSGAPSTQNQHSRSFSEWWSPVSRQPGSMSSPAPAASTSSVAVSVTTTAFAPTYGAASPYARP